MIVSLLYEATRKLPSAASVLLRGEAETDAELPVLRHQNTVWGAATLHRIVDLR